MKKLRYSGFQKRWSLFSGFERKGKSQILRNISKRGGFELLKELHQFACGLHDKPNCKEFDKAKIDLLARVHAIFGRIKP